MFWKTEVLPETSLFFFPLFFSRKKKKLMMASEKMDTKNGRVTTEKIQSESPTKFYV